MLNDIEVLLIAGDTEEALRKLANVRGRLDGCGTRADKKDWVIVCTSQLQIRVLVDLLIRNLQ